MKKALDSQKGDGKQQEKMLDETPDQDVLKKKIIDMVKEIATLKNQQANNEPVSYQQQAGNTKNEFSQGNPKPGGKLFTKRICYYCHREGYGKFNYPEALKDKQQWLVKMTGKNRFLPSGQKIPWNPNRPS